MCGCKISSHLSNMRLLVLSSWPMHARYLELGWVCAIYKNCCVVAMVGLILGFVFGHAIFTVSNWSVRHLWMQITYPPIIVSWPSLVWTPDRSDWEGGRSWEITLLRLEFHEIYILHALFSYLQCDRSGTIQIFNIPCPATHSHL